LKRVQR